MYGSVTRKEAFSNTKAPTMPHIHESPVEAWERPSFCLTSQRVPYCSFSPREATAGQDIAQYAFAPPHIDEQNRRKTRHVVSKTRGSTPPSQQAIDPDFWLFGEASCYIPHLFLRGHRDCQ